MSTESVQALFDKWNEALQSRDPDKVTALYAEDAILLPTVSNKVRHNHEEIRDYFEHFLKKNPRGTIDESNVREYGEDVAVNAGVYTFELTDGDASSRVAARFTFLYEKQGDEWKIVEHHSSAMPEHVTA